MSTLEGSPRPLQVSPVIKFARWSLLLTGILYGMYHQKRFTKKENALREKERIERPIREAKLKEERQKKMEAEMKELNAVLQIK